MSHLAQGCLTTAKKGPIQAPVKATVVKTPPVDTPVETKAVQVTVADEIAQLKAQLGIQTPVQEVQMAAPASTWHYLDVRPKESSPVTEEEVGELLDLGDQLAELGVQIEETECSYCGYQDTILVPFDSDREGFCVSCIERLAPLLYDLSEAVAALQLEP